MADLVRAGNYEAACSLVESNPLMCDELLVVALKAGQYEIAEFLLENGACYFENERLVTHMYQRETSLKSILEMALDIGDLRFVEHLHEGGKILPYHEFCTFKTTIESGNFEKLSILLKFCSPNDAKEWGFGWLFTAVCCGNVAMCRAIIQKANGSFENVKRYGHDQIKWLTNLSCNHGLLAQLLLDQTCDSICKLILETGVLYRNVTLVQLALNGLKARDFLHGSDDGKERLLKLSACIIGDLAMLQSFEISHSKTELTELLCYSLHHGLCDLTQFLISQCSINQLNSCAEIYYPEDQQTIVPDLLTPLMIACELGDWNLIKVLVEQREVDINGRSVIGDLRQKWTALNKAVASGHFEIVDYLIAKGACLSFSWKDIPQVGYDYKDSESWRPQLSSHSSLMIACEANNIEMVRHLAVKHKANVHEILDGATPLTIAVYLNNVELVQLLLYEHEAKPMKGDFYIAYSVKNREIIKALESSCSLKLVNPFSSFLAVQTTHYHEGSFYCSTFSRAETLINVIDMHPEAINDSTSGFTYLSLLSLTQSYVNFDVREVLTHLLKSGGMLQKHKSPSMTAELLNTYLSNTFIDKVWYATMHGDSYDYVSLWMCAVGDSYWRWTEEIAQLMVQSRQWLHLNEFSYHQFTFDFSPERLRWNSVKSLQWLCRKKIWQSLPTGIDSRRRAYKELVKILPSILSAYIQFNPHHDSEQTVACNFSNNQHPSSQQFKNDMPKLLNARM